MIHLPHATDTMLATDNRRRPATLRVSRRVADSETANACYFRSGGDPGRRKALLQITERCDLRCAHCFVSATHTGSDMSIEDFAAVIDRLDAARVSHVTITGGEPFVHPDVLQIVELLARHRPSVTICTNAVSITAEHIELLRRLPGVGVNVSLDGFSANSHGRFRGDRRSFDVTTANARLLAEVGLLKGILCTPNTFADPSEYSGIYLFARDLGARSTSS